jgi:hypothetical protein
LALWGALSQAPPPDAGGRAWLAAAAPFAIPRAALAGALDENTSLRSLRSVCPSSALTVVSWSRTALRLSWSTRSSTSSLVSVWHATVCMCFALLCWCGSKLRSPGPRPSATGPSGPLRGPMGGKLGKLGVVAEW